MEAHSGVIYLKIVLFKMEKSGFGSLARKVKRTKKKYPEKGINFRNNFDSI